MSCLEHICPIVGCDEAFFDNDYTTHYCPTHKEPMIKHWDEEHNEPDRDDDRRED